MIREAIQNSCDAKSDVSRNVRFAIDAFDFDAKQLSWLHELFQEIPPGVGLGEALMQSSIRALVLSDRGTVGLAGPTRTDYVDEDTEDKNFVEFFRNVGRLDRVVIGGGTYGFGKASLYQMSEADTIMAYSRVRAGRAAETRLMAAALGSQYREPGKGRGKNCTGRHWWGRQEDEIVEPLRGREADRVASVLGFPAFEGDETGTSIMILAPRVGDVSLSDFCRSLSEAALWYIWPRMLKDARGQSDFVLNIRCDGKRMNVPAIEEHSVLKHYEAAYRLALEKGNQRAPSGPFRLARFEVWCQRPIKLLGSLGLSRIFSNAVAQEVPEDGLQLNSVPTGILSHVALLRAPRMVVKYVQCPAPTDGAGMVGVFVADPELNSVFADAEPVTHDGWNGESLERRNDQTYVRVSLRRIFELTREYLQPADVGEAATASVPLGALSKFLGGLVATSSGSGAEGQPIGGTGTIPGSGTTRNSVRLEPRREISLSRHGGVTVAKFPLRVKGLIGPTRINISVKPFVVVADGSPEGDMPIGGIAPEIVGWESPDGTVSEGSSDIVAIARNNDDFAVSVSVPGNVAVSIQASVRRTTGS
jgi:hypothetical protein